MDGAERWLAASLNRRMHNKVFIVDNTLAVVGGRNIGNHYFGVDTTSNFRDLDLLAAGPVVKDISDSFDLFWNSRYAIPAEVLMEGKHREDFDNARDELYAWTEVAYRKFPYKVFVDRQRRIARFKQGLNKLTWADAEVTPDQDRIGRIEPEKLQAVGEALALALTRVVRQSSY